MSATTDPLAPVNDDRYDAGYALAWGEYEPGEPVPDPVGVDDDFQFGYWVGIGHAAAWNEGWTAAERGMLVCPYRIGADDECFRESWLSGYGDALLGLKTDRIAAHA